MIIEGSGDCAHALTSEHSILAYATRTEMPCAGLFEQNVMFLFSTKLRS